MVENWNRPLTYPGRVFSVFREIPHGTADENESGGEVEIVKTIEEVFTRIVDDVASTELSDMLPPLESKQLVNSITFIWSDSIDLWIDWSVDTMTWMMKQSTTDQPIKIHIVLESEHEQSARRLLKMTNIARMYIQTMSAAVGATTSSSFTQTKPVNIVIRTGESIEKNVPR